MKNRQDNLIERDYTVNWHPYTQMKTAQNIIPIVRGEGSYLYDANDKRYIDAVSSWWVTLHGHSHPYIAQKLTEQLTTLEQVIFAGFTHQPAIELSERLLALLPSNQTKAFYTDNGSTAIEVALKMAIQANYNKGGKKNKIIAFNNGYHGDTFGAMSVSGRGIWTDPFGAMLFEVLFIEVPTAENLESIKKTIGTYAEETICFIYEPLVQGAGGMLMHKAEHLSALMNYCKERDILLIQDEIFVGFGRTGQLFAANHLSESPDIMCFSKGLTGGTLPLGITTCTEDLYQAFYADDKTKALFHGHSFTASPLACTAALASMDLLLSKDTQGHIKRIAKQHKSFIQQLKQHPKVQDARQCGTIFAMEWKTTECTSYFSDMHDILYPFFLERGVLMRPLGNIIYLVPPYCTTDEDLAYIYSCILEALEMI
ncbi:adenosylmethionine-8-amino-7-oxononanoate aminotransferase [Myroides odoratimimus]|uniref:Adenosylmethionine-8-amino-7-oxononanoate aminotransferase n=1 Tax=Myroides odoratimimus CCUG 10230 TaxID=883150 RepID=A0ABP2NC00_9FLAO|nr:adenosylmethionine--8-amino-7-oxononanoate transaminase [Myroides odoratimimus]EHO10293.1 adenosylmethionine-8-amino-7-oxononanoate transaminase [Myroides odoratimimus CCUG 10230]MCO7724819.1 adenosylmethionine--8-amino-7-oxononanoate transaminase [Myroides odoratimimus]MDM1067334.1 adenosylmethionine--8-amino-7-oxononanoate transaminase [Myroides odoratimimus]MDM1461992.1 adenosylmethionine--8-amino-7-oxononanoate transaminase [Myroides odoratimimus]MEC4026931.1 adenosylmethionine--8-amino